MLNSILNFLLGKRQVVAVFDGVTFYHHAKDRNEALAWLNAYPVNSAAYVYNRFGTLTAYRLSGNTGRLISTTV